MTGTINVRIQSSGKYVRTVLSIPVHSGLGPPPIKRVCWCCFAKRTTRRRAATERTGRTMVKYLFCFVVCLLCLSLVVLLACLPACPLAFWILLLSRANTEHVKAVVGETAKILSVLLLFHDVKLRLFSPSPCFGSVGSVSLCVCVCLCVHVCVVFNQPFEACRSVLTDVYDDDENTTKRQNNADATTAKRPLDRFG